MKVRYLTIECDAVKILCACNLRRYFHATTNQRLAEYVLHGTVKTRLVRQFVDHRDRILLSKTLSMKCNERASGPQQTTKHYEYLCIRGVFKPPEC